MLLLLYTNVKQDFHFQFYRNYFSFNQNSIFVAIVRMWCILYKFTYDGLLGCHLRVIAISLASILQGAADLHSECDCRKFIAGYSHSQWAKFNRLIRFCQPFVLWFYVHNCIRWKAIEIPWHFLRFYKSVDFIELIFYWPQFGCCQCCWFNLRSAYTRLKHMPFLLRRCWHAFFASCFFFIPYGWNHYSSNSIRSDNSST